MRNLSNLVLLKLLYILLYYDGSKRLHLILVHVFSSNFLEGNNKHKQNHLDIHTLDIHTFTSHPDFS